MNDKEIVDLYWMRSEQAIQETEKKYGKYCHIIAYNILGNPEDSEECVNDTWLAAWNAMPDKRPERLNPFLANITRNFALSKIVRQNAKKRGGGEVELALEELDDCIPSGYSLEKELEDRELAQAIDHFIRTLSEEEAFAFIARYYFLATEREIAEKRGYTRSKVSMMLKRSRDRLKKYLLQEGLCEIQNV